MEFDTAAAADTSGFVRKKSSELTALTDKTGRILCIDQGNSRAKACLFEAGKLVVWESDFNPLVARIWGQRYELDAAVISSVASEPNSELYGDALAGITELITASAELRLPFLNRYRSAKQGPDRIAAICGAMLALDGPMLIMDAGTCLTYELLSPEGVYLGGVISPGLGMRLRAMHTFTAGLPLLSPVGQAPLMGLSTEDCMMSGAFNGLLFEASGYYSALSGQYPDLKVLLTGGAAPLLEAGMRNSTSLRLNLVCEGLLLLYALQQEHTEMEGDTTTISSTISTLKQVKLTSSGIENNI
jgi:type III pantothenate kinase